MKKIIDFFKPKYICMGISLYLLADFFLEGPLENIKFFLYIDMYIGKIWILIGLLIGINLILSFVISSDKRKLFPISVEFIIIGSLCVVYLYFMIQLKIPFENKIADQTLLRNSINITLFKNQIGYIPAYLFYLLLSKFNYLIVYTGLVGILLLSITISFVYPLIKWIVNLYREYIQKERMNSEIALKRKEAKIEASGTENKEKNNEKQSIKIETLAINEIINNAGNEMKEEIKKEENKKEENKKEEKRVMKIGRSEFEKNKNDLVNSFDYFVGKERKPKIEITNSDKQFNIIKIAGENKNNNKNNKNNSNLTNNIKEKIREELKEELMNEIKNEIKNEIVKEINTENIRESIKENIKENIKEQTELKEVLNNNVEKDQSESSNDKKQEKKIIKLPNLVDIYAMLEKEQEQLNDKEKKDSKAVPIVKLYKK
ncbi:MAG: hypothetical protein LBT51_08470 [Fusobacteriaceae bacterium]|jgi:hypothetical protein|nr:hypothetical protein [Fusobacteriaceae bacterium]